MAPWARRLGCVLALDKCVQMWTRNYGALGQTARVCFGVLCANKKKEEVKRDFGDLRIRRSEGRVVNAPMVFKRVLFEETGEKEKKRERIRRTGGKEKEQRKRTKESGRENGRKEEERRKRERGDGKRRKESRGERESDARLEWKKGLSPEIGVKKTMNAGGVEYGNRN
ncbi:hypothetical protein TNCV_3204521 [Trichonephila clavipes]|nr:hypothetical protein TNCV_3204521 [Trichonephila clavipes]